MQQGVNNYPLADPSPKTETSGAGDFEAKTIGDINFHQAGNRAGDRSEGISDRGGKFHEADNGGTSQEIFQSNQRNGDVQQTKTRGIGGDAGRGRQVPGPDD